MKVYIVTEGSYSDYHIEAVFTDEEQAKYYCATHSDECEIEEYDTDTVHFDTDKEIKELWCGWFDCYGNYQESLKNRLVVGDTPIDIWRNRRGNIRIEKTFPCDTTEKTAKKVFCDIYAQWKAQQIEMGVRF